MSKKVSKSSDNKPKNKKFKFLILLFPIIGITIYSNIFGNTFHFDDYVWRNLRCVQEFDLKGIWEFAPLRTISFLTFAFNYSIGGFNTEGYYLFNIFIHIINAILVWKLSFLVLELLPAININLKIYKNEIAFFTAVIFLCHPLQTQVVSYVYQRMASLAAMFYLLTIIFFLLAQFKYIDKRKKNIVYVLMIFCLFASLLTKENSFSIILILPILMLFFSQRKINFDKRTIIVLSIIIIASIVLIITGDVASVIFKTYKNYRGEDINNLNYFFTQFKVVLHYFRLALFPFGQSIDHDIPIENNVLTLTVIIPLLIHSLLLTVAFYFYKKDRMITFSIFWIYITLAIESSIIPIRDVMFEHRMYLPLFGFSLLITYTTFNVLFNSKFKIQNSKSKIIIIIILSVLSLFYSTITYHRNSVWKNDITLWSDVIKNYPDNARAYNARGLEYYRKLQYTQSIKDFKLAIEKYPEYNDAFANLGNVFFSMGKFNEAVTNLTRAIKINKNYEYFYNRGNSYFRMNELDSAIKDYSICFRLNDKFKSALIRRADARFKNGELFRALKDLNKTLELDKNDLEANMMAGEVEFNLGKYRSALKTFSRAIKLAPDNKEAFTNRATVNFQLGNFQDAIEDFLIAIKLDPLFIPAYKNLGLTYEKLKNFEKAIEVYNQALKIISRDYELYYLRGNSYLGVNDFDNAIKDFKSAISINPDFTKAKNKLILLLNKYKRIN